MFNKLDPSNIPAHIGIIMDGNGRFATRRGLVRHAGHSMGVVALRKIVTKCYDLGVKTLTVYAFSTENWKRPKEEIAEIMRLLLKFLNNYIEELSGRDIRLLAMGDTSAFPNEIQEALDKVQTATKNNKKMTMYIGLNYGGRAEIVNAVREISAKVASGEIDASEINENTVSNHLYGKDNADIDLIIRTSGEKRVSNFLLWQSAYSELWFCDELWPSFSEKLLVKAIIDYQRRNRRLGGV